MLSDLIAAIATAPGRAAISVIRLSGRDAFDVARRVLGWTNQQAITPRRATLGIFHDRTDAPFDQGLVTFFPAEQSYTGEELVELCSHGGMFVPAQLLATLQAHGARLAAPGEFTRRAVQNGKLDLLQAEAVGDLVDATTRLQGRGALGQLAGGLSRRLDLLRGQLVDLLALLSYEIDFPEEDDGPVERSAMVASLEAVAGSVAALLRTAPLGQRVRGGALVVLAGRPNVGKSSLFNALLGRERALVTEIPGTTRDAIEADLDLDGWPVRVVDTAGLHASDDRVERMGIEVSRKYLAAADVVLLCVEAGVVLDDEERSLALESKTILARTKADLHPDAPLSEAGRVAVSAETGAGLDELARILVTRLFGEPTADLEPMLTRERHRVALEHAAIALADGHQELHREEGDAVLVAHHVRRAMAALDELIGAVDVDEVLGRVFSSFCVGK